VTDSKNPEQKPAPAPGTSSSSAPYISPKLREKLMESDSGEEWSPRSGPPIGGIVIALLVVGGGVAGVMWMRSSAAKHHDEEIAQARADSLAEVAHAESLAVAARADSTARADSLAALPPSVKAAMAREAAAKAAAARAASSTTAGKPSGSTSPSTASAPAAPPAPATDGFGIAIGTFMSEERAGSERDRVGGVTGLAGIVAPKDDGGTTVYRVILGKFGNRGAAERKAQALMDSSLVREANVVARPKSGS
jgi:cell division septation protein DedD